MSSSIIERESFQSLEEASAMLAKLLQNFHICVLILLCCLCFALHKKTLFSFFFIHTQFSTAQSLICILQTFSFSPAQKCTFRVSTRRFFHCNLLCQHLWWWWWWSGCVWKLAKTKEEARNWPDGDEEEVRPIELCVFMCNKFFNRNQDSELQMLAL